MTYQEWSKQYYESAELLSERIEVLTAQMKTAAAEQLQEMNRRLELMRIMRRECMQTAALLGRRKGEC